MLIFQTIPLNFDCYGSILVSAKLKDYSKRHPIPLRTPLRGTNSAAPVSWDRSLSLTVQPDRRRCRAATLTLIVTSLPRSYPESSKKDPRL